LPLEAFGPVVSAGNSLGGKGILDFASHSLVEGETDPDPIRRALLRAGRVRSLSPMGATQMTKQNTTAGPTGMHRIRSFVAFRHQNPAARFLSTVVAFAIAMLLVLGSGAAYADDAKSPTDPATATTDPATATATDTTTSTDKAAPSAPTADPATTTTTTTSTTSPKSFSKLSTSTKLNPLASTPPAVPDWIWQGSAPTLDDGEKDDTAYGQGSSEDTNPSTWSKAGADSPKTDLLKYYFNVDSTSDIIVSFGFTRAATTGDTAFAVEMNRLANTSDNPPQPNRSVGDLLLKFHVDSGSSPLTFAHAFLWKPTSAFAAHNQAFPQFGGNACTQVYNSGFGWCEIPKTGFQGRTADDGFTAEGKVNLTDLFGSVGCSGAFHSVNLRSESSSENWTNSLQDYLPLAGASVPDTCASLVIDKYRLGADGHTYTAADLLSGAHFDVYAGATATGSPVISDVYDGKAGVDTDSVTGQITLTGLDPGTYTVKETSGPTGYFAPSGTVCATPDIVGLCSIRTKTVGQSGTATYSFYDLKQWQALQSSKTATGSYDVTYDWSILKGVGSTTAGPFDPSFFEKDVADDGVGDTSASFGYEVTVTQGAQHTSNIGVSGTISVTNPNDENVAVTLSDTLAGATCSITGGSSQIAVPGANSFGYTCSYPAGTLPQDLASTNNASVSWSKSDYPQSVADYNAGGNYTLSPSHAVAWTAHETNKTVTVTDDHHDFTNGGVDPAWTITWSAQGTTETRTYARSISAAAGSCTSETNTAFVKDGLTTLDSDDATAKVCVGADLGVTKVSKESLTRAYLWDITKTNTDNDPLFVDPATGHVTTHWNITVTADGKQDSGYLMSGTITVSNPNSWEDVVLTGLTDSYSGGGTCTVDGWNAMTVADKTIPEGGSKDFDYTCSFVGTTPTLSGTNTATATWSSAAAHTPNGTDHYDLPILESDWTLDAEINKSVTVTDGVVGGDPAVQIAGPFTWSDGFSTTFEYTVDLGAPAGECQTWTNTAHLLGDASAELDSSSDTVEVCNAKQLTVDKTAAGHFDRTYHWSLDKSVSADPASDAATWTDSDSWTGPEYSHIFGYRVTLSQLPWSDSNFTITGSITLTNPNSDPTIPDVSSTITDTPDVGAAASCVVDGGADDGESLVGYATSPIASGDSLTIDYRCTVADLTPDQYTGGENSVTATNASDSPATAPVTFTKAGEFDKSVTVVDDKVTLSTPEVLGSVTYDEAVPDKTYHWDYQLSHTATAVACQDFTNAASVFSDDSVVLDALALLSPLDSAQATATVCPQPGTWVVGKDSNVGDGAVPVGSTRCTWS
jgi:hypothetical protein